MLNAMTRQEPARIEINPGMPRFASEEEDERGRYVPQAMAAEVAAPVVQREPAQHFREPEPEPAYREEVYRGEAYAEPEAAGVTVAQEPVQPQMFGVSFDEQPAEDLEIPAFLRKGGL
jgi:hypothetical protein